MSQITVGGTAAPGNAPQDNPVYVGASDGSNVRALLVDASGRPIVTGAQADGAAVVGNPQVIAGTDGTNARVPLVNSARQLYVNHEMQKATYSAAFLNITPAATATDFFSIFGTGSKTIRILRAWLVGVATAATTVDILVKLRTTANSLGTPTNVNIVKLDQNDGAASAQPVTYGVNPTIGTDGNNWETTKMFLPPASASPTQPTAYVFDPARNFSKHVVLRGTAQGLVFNFNGAAVPTGMVVSGGVLWTEE